QTYSHLDGTTAFDRFLGGALNTNDGAYKPGGVYANQVTARKVAYAKRDWFLFLIGLDHNQWIRWLNPGNSFAFSAQIFYTQRNGVRTDVPNPSAPFTVFNQRDGVASRDRNFQKPVTNATAAAHCDPGTGSRAGCASAELPSSDWLTTFTVSTPYLGGNLR